MPLQQLHKFTATPDGIQLNGFPLTKDAFSNLPSQSLRYVKRAKELLAKVKKEDWDNSAPHDINHVPVLAKANMMLALASPYDPVVNKYSPDQPRDYHGRWTDAGAGEGIGNEAFDEKHIDNLFAQAFLAFGKPSPAASLQPQPFDDSNDRVEPAYPLENLIAFLGTGEVLAALRGARVAAETATPALNTAVEDAASAIRQYLGNDAKMIVNDNGDLVLMNDTQKIRFDVNDPHGYDPHFHIEEWDGSNWVDAGNQHHYYFKDK